MRVRVAGLTVALRLVLTAQRGGASAVHLVGCDDLAPSLVDPRVKIPIRVEPPPEDVTTIEVPADVVVHDAAFKALAEAASDGRARSLGQGDTRIEARPPRDVRHSGGPPAPLVFAPPFAFPPIRVTTRREAMRATTALLRACRKKADGWTSTYLNRYVSLSVTRLLLHTPIKPNYLTVANLALGVASGVIAARGDHDSLVIGAALLQTQSTLDGCDGELARVTYQHSRVGEWLDTIGDDLSNYTFFAGASFGMHRTTGHTMWLIVGAIIVGCGAIASAIEYRYLLKVGSGDLLVYPILQGPKKNPESVDREPIAGRIAVALQPLFKRDTFVLLCFLAAAIGVLSPMLIASALGAIIVLSQVIRTEIRLARQPGG